MKIPATVLAAINAVFDPKEGRRGRRERKVSPLSPPPADFVLDAGISMQSGDTGYYHTVMGGISREPIEGATLLECATRNSNYFQVAFVGDVLTRVEGWTPQIAGIEIGTLMSGWAFDGSNTTATWIDSGTMASGHQYNVTWANT